MQNQGCFRYVFLVAVLVTCLVPAFVQAQMTLYYSLDIGSDWEMSDPNTPGPIDPGDILLNTGMIKDDAQIFGFDPAPPAGVLVGTPYEIGIETNYFDLDGEDQLDRLVEPIEGPIEADPIDGLILNPENILFSVDDDQPQGWYSQTPTYPTGDVPVNAIPNHGSDTNEIIHAAGWYNWQPIPGNPYSTETALGLTNDPLPQINDDDVDALDTEMRRYWYWSSDHEATSGTDPADIYGTDLTGAPGYWTAVDNWMIMVADGTDIDAFEFIVTDDAAILDHFNIPHGRSYLALLFSVDQDDPITLADESGGLDPTVIYISLLTGVPPMALNSRETDGDVDALTVFEYTLDFGDAPNSYGTTIASNGACHTATGPWLGGITNNPDTEADGLPDANAMGDDNNNRDDERGVWIATGSHLITGVATTYTVTVNGGGLTGISMALSMQPRNW